MREPRVRQAPAHPRSRLSVLSSTNPIIRSLSTPETTARVPERQKLIKLIKKLTGHTPAYVGDLGVTQCASRATPVAAKKTRVVSVTQNRAYEQRL